MRQDSTDNANYESTYVELAWLETSSKRVLAVQCSGICIFSLCLCRCSSGTPTVLRHAHTEFGKFHCPFEWMCDDPLRCVFLSLSRSRTPLTLNRRVVGTILCMTAKCVFRLLDSTFKLNIDDCQWVAGVLTDYSPNRAGRTMAWSRKRVCPVCEWPAEGALTKLREFRAWWLAPTLIFPR